MRSFYFFIIALVLVSACNSSKNQEASSSTETWILTEMTNGRADIPTMSGESMIWQERLVLHPDGSFVKYREMKGQKMEATGTYAYVDLSDGKYLELVFEKSNELIGNCTGDLKELLRVNEEGNLSGTWQACDGPGLTYQRSQ